MSTDRTPRGAVPEEHETIPHAVGITIEDQHPGVPGAPGLVAIEAVIADGLRSLLHGVEPVRGPDGSFTVTVDRSPVRVRALYFNTRLVQAVVPIARGVAAAKLTGSSGGYVKYTSTKRRAASFTATGRTFAFVTTKARSRGKAEIWLDGKRVTTLDLYATATQAGRIVWSKTFATSGKHTLKIIVTGTKRSAATSVRVDIDAFVVLR